ncbi:S-adenosylmethionine-diacylglycerol 3-amino-3-carboxypropyl transferase [Sphaerotilus hippei]|uniref:S-adenosylmethionine-diacylglycerol 3-amino-3-carboxypropyl transferase n=1 Tax=Sphaerotilus hippei TaxID=744406 RepID=A0A318H675_9BURK|nr:DUF3419 family protein [Sphaerotilus hippei]PXW97948.1 S-adenosylmethionine-diacylglycerol 3-amino-3-carboxypropyl transferase [Sphaerotilus hippei]
MAPPSDDINSSVLSRTGTGLIAHTVHDHEGHQASLADRFFARWFDRLVYTQIWEDPQQDIEALGLDAQSRIVTIASAGCNVLNYLSARPAAVLALDINPHHIALTRLKIAGVKALDRFDDFHRFFGEAQGLELLQIYQRHLRPALDDTTRDYWDRTRLGHARIEMFSRGFYREGVLGRFIGLLHRLCRLQGIDLTGLFDCRGVEEQAQWFDRTVAPLFARPWVVALCRSRTLLYSLGIPPRQYLALCDQDPGRMAAVLCERARRIATLVDWQLNPWAQQAYGRAYRSTDTRGWPLYLQSAHWDTLKQQIARVHTELGNFRQVLSQRPDQHFDAYVLLDAQDWMSARELDGLWREIDRTASARARVIFRTAGQDLPAPGLPAWVGERWVGDPEGGRAWLARDRSGIYGGFHAWRRR